MIMGRMSQGPTATKRSVLEQLLDQGMVLVALDARREGVDVPVHLAGDPQLRLNLSYRFGLPMSVESWGVRATLTFAGVPYTCRFPWEAIFLVVSHISGQPYLFPDDIPPELLQHGPEAAASLAAGPGPSTGRPPKLTLIHSAAEQPQESKGRRASAPRGRSAHDEDGGGAKAGAPASSRGAGKARNGSAAAAADVATGAHPSKRRAGGKKAPTPPEEAPAPADDGDRAAQPQPGGRQRGHLRLVK